MDDLQTLAVRAAALLAGAFISAPVLAGSDPLDPAAPVPPLQHQSVLTAPPALDAARVGSWRDANATVNRIGGWKAYAREVTPEAKPSTPDPRPAPATDPGHRHH